MASPTISTKSLSQFKTHYSKPLQSGRIIVLSAAVKIDGALRAAGLPGELANRAGKVLARRSVPLKAGELIKIQAIEKNEPDVDIAVLPEDRSAFSLLGFARMVWKATLENSDQSIGILLSSADAALENLLVDVLSAALSVRLYAMPEYGKRLEKKKPFALKTVTFFGKSIQQKAADTGWQTGEAANFVRGLGTLPPNELHTEDYGKRIKAVAKKYGFDFKFYSAVELKKMGAGAFTAVDRGDPDSNGGIYEITYSPSKARNKKPVALVGKGICYDTGGYDIKTQGYMMHMKGDMMGSALALSGLMMAAELKIPLKMKAFLSVTENHISPRAYRADEVVTALNGIAIEVVNTDAEGRMILADALALASRAKPELMIDFATLTGAAHIAIGQSYAAGFTNDEKLHTPIVQAGRESGERVWTFPIDDDFGKPLESAIADTLQCAKGRSPDHIIAAYFLKKFVDKDISWVHIDLAAADKEGGLAHVDTLFSGFGARWLLQFLRDRYKV